MSDHLPRFLRTALLLCAAALTLHGFDASAQAWPQKPIRIIVPIAPGGIADTFSRIIGVRLTELWGQAAV